MDWMLPGIAPTGKRVECATVAIVQFRDGKLFNEHLYWDQASVLVQLGLLDHSTLPIAGAETARKVPDPSLPSNQLMQRLRPAAAAKEEWINSYRYGASGNVVPPQRDTPRCA